MGKVLTGSMTAVGRSIHSGIRVTFPFLLGLFWKEGNYGERIPAYAPEPALGRNISEAKLERALLPAWLPQLDSLILPFEVYPSSLSLITAIMEISHR